MDTSKILVELRAERERIDQAIAALEALNSAGAFTTRPQASPVVKQTAVPTNQTSKVKRTMSASARRRISQAAKARWAAKKQTAQPKTSAKQAAPKPTAAKKADKGGLTAAGRKRISDMMKKRWAERKKKAAKAA